MIIIRNIVAIGYILIATICSYPRRIYLRIRNKDNCRRYEINYYTLKKIVKRVLKIIGVKIDFLGNKELFSKKGAFMYVGNHRSNMDSLILIAYIEQPVVFIGKYEIKKMPIVGAWFKDIGAIFIKREDIRASVKIIAEGIERLKKGHSVVIFPEGGRRNEEKVQDFKPGSFKLSIRSNADIIPFAFYNTEASLEKRGFFYPANIGLCVADIVEYKKLNLTNTVELAEYITRVVSDMYSLMKEAKK